MKRFFLLLCCGVMLLGGCGKSSKDTMADAYKKEDVKKEEVKKEPEPDPHEGKKQSPLTGVWIDEDLADKRPVAVTINNLHKALPQSGLEKADILYEVPAEGEITRIVAVFQDYMAEKIGPVRSARDYFTYFALDNDAIYVHHGGSPGAYVAIPKRGVNAINGMYDTIAFYRDKERMNKSGMYEHSSFITGEGLKESIDSYDFRTEMETSYRPMFSFYDEDTDITGEIADDVTLPFSYYQISQFKYDGAKKVYERIQSGTPQIDDNTGETVTVKNVIIQLADMYVIPGDDEGRRDVGLVGDGSGYMITNGKVQQITWEKRSYSEPTQWFDGSGKKLKLNSGKTWVCVYPTGRDDITFTAATEEE